METKKKTEKIKDTAKKLNRPRNWVAIGCTAVVLGCTLFGRCDGCLTEGPMPVPTRRVDGVVVDSEVYPAMLNENGTVMCEENDKATEKDVKICGEGASPVKNDRYTKEDAHNGDLRCDNDPKNLEDPLDNPVTLAEKDAFDRDYKFIPETSNPDADPREASFSIDCARLECSDDPDAPIIDREPITRKTKVKRLEWDTEKGEEVVVEEYATPYEGLVALTPESIEESFDRKGNRVISSPIRSVFWRLREYIETKDRGLLCSDPKANAECRCPNLKKWATPRETPPAPKPPKPKPPKPPHGDVTPKPPPPVVPTTTQTEGGEFDCPGRMHSNSTIDTLRQDAELNAIDIAPDLRELAGAGQNDTVEIGINYTVSANAKEGVRVKSLVLYVNGKFRVGYPKIRSITKDLGLNGSTISIDTGAFQKEENKGKVCKMPQMRITVVSE